MYRVIFIIIIFCAYDLFECFVLLVLRFRIVTSDIGC